MQVKLHPWFADLNWGSLSRTKAAFIPALESETDVSYFEARKPVRTNRRCRVPAAGAIACRELSETLQRTEAFAPAAGTTLRQAAADVLCKHGHGHQAAAVERDLGGQHAQDAAHH